MMNEYDVVIIGAGPCGIVCALELAEQHKKVLLIDKGNVYNKRLCHVDMGRSCTNCPECNVISGFGGCVHYGDSVKLTSFPSGKALYNKLGTNYEELLDKACVYWGVCRSEELLLSNLKSTTEKFEIKNYPICVMNSRKVKERIEYFYKQIEESEGLWFWPNKKMIQIEKEKKKFKIFFQDNDEVYAEKIVMAMGRGGMLWLKENLKKLDIQTQIPVSTMGLRFEMPKRYLQRIGQGHPDLKIRKIINGKKYKTFCYCAGVNGGRIKYVNYGKYILLDGHILTETDLESEFGNFALLMQILLPEDYDDSYQRYIENIINKYKAMNNGQPIYQPFCDFKEACNKEKGKNKHKISIKNIPYRNVYKLFEDELQSFCSVAEEIFNYIIEGTGIQYEEFIKEINVIALEMEGLWDKIETDDCFETSCKGIYAGGDCGGETQGILQASINGIKIATSILNEYKE